MPPPMMTKVIPMLMTPMIEPRRRIDSGLSTLAKRSPRGDYADEHQWTTSAMMRPRVRPTEPRKIS